MSLRYSICWLISNITAIITTSQRIISLKAPSRSLTSNWYMNSLNIQWGDSLTTSHSQFFKAACFIFSQMIEFEVLIQALLEWLEIFHSPFLPLSLLPIVLFSFNRHVPISGQPDPPSWESSCLFLCNPSSFSVKSGIFSFRVRSVC